MAFVCSLLDYCFTAKNNILRWRHELIHLHVMPLFLHDKEVITETEKEKMETMENDGENYMEYLIDEIIVPSLEGNDLKKFGGFVDQLANSSFIPDTSYVDKLSMLKVNAAIYFM